MIIKTMLDYLNALLASDIKEFEDLIEIKKILTLIDLKDEDISIISRYVDLQIKAILKLQKGEFKALEFKSESQ